MQQPWHEAIGDEEETRLCGRTAPATCRVDEAALLLRLRLGESDWRLSGED